MNTKITAAKGCETVDSELFSYLYNYCSEERRNRADKFLRREDAYRCLIAEILLYYSTYNAGFTSKLKMCISPDNGKPYFADSPLYFNLTHSGDWVGCVLSENEAGIDIEKVHSIDTSIANHFFSPSENKLLSQCNRKEDLLNLFFEIWVLKESYIKAIGKGLSCKLDSFSTIPEQTTVQLYLHDKELPVKYLKLFHISEDYKCSVCYTEKDFKEDFEIIAVDQLLDFLRGSQSINFIQK